jgi:hypothetical protein
MEEMNRDDIIRMAREAGFEVDSDDVWITDGFWVEELERFATSVYERAFIDGMQKQMQSSVDKAVNKMAQREWQGLTDEEMLNAYAPNRIPDSAYSNMGEDLKKIHDATKEEMLSGLRAIEAKLKEKNT